MQQIPRGQPIQVTHDQADNYEPAFSPDGGSIAFRSDRDGGGIYVIPTFGSEPRKIVDQGRQPRYSPDGASIVYWVGGRFGGGPLYVVPSAGGQPRQLPAPPGNSPVWAPDGTHVLFRKRWDDWYVVPIGGGPAVKTGVVDVLLRHGFSVGAQFQQVLLPDPELWLSGGNTVVFSATTGDSTGLWKIAISPRTWQVAGAPRRLTVGAGLYTYASASADGRIVFASLARNPDIWSLPIDANGGKVTGEIQQLTNDASDDLSPSVSADGKRMVFESNRTGKRIVWTKDLTTGKERALTETSSAENLPIISPDGSEVVYLIVNQPLDTVNGLMNYKGELRVIPFEGGLSKKVLDGYQQPFQWSSDNNRILYVDDQEEGLPSHLRWLDVRTGEKVKLLMDAQKEICAGWVSPMNKELLLYSSKENRCLNGSSRVCGMMEQLPRKPLSFLLAATRSDGLPMETCSIRHLSRTVSLASTRSAWTHGRSDPWSRFGLFIISTAPAARSMKTRRGVALLWLRTRS